MKAGTHHVWNTTRCRSGRQVVQSVKSAPRRSRWQWLGVVAIHRHCGVAIVSGAYISHLRALAKLDSATREPTGHSLAKNLRDDHPGTTVGTSAGFQLAAEISGRAGQSEQ